MNLFGELLFATDHPNPRRFDARESQPVPAGDCFQRLHNHVTNAGVQVAPLNSVRIDGADAAGITWVTS